MQCAIHVSWCQVLAQLTAHEAAMALYTVHYLNVMWYSVPGGLSSLLMVEGEELDVCVWEV